MEVYSGERKLGYFDLLRETGNPVPESSRYHSLYNRATCDFTDLTQLPIEQERTPDVFQAAATWAIVSGFKPSQIEEISRGQVSQSEASHLIRRTGRYSPAVNSRERNRERARAPVTLRRLFGLGQIHEDYPLSGRIPLLFYDLESGLLYLPFGKDANPREITYNFVVPYLGMTEQPNVRIITEMLSRRFANIRKRNSESVLKGEPRPPVHKFIFGRETFLPKSAKLLRKEDLNAIGENSRVSRIITGFLGPHGLSLETAFLLPRVDVADRDALVDKVAEHLKRIDDLN